jgi:hypothetical protein
MTSNEQTDPILRLLDHLPTPATRAARNEQVRSKCHAVMARRDVRQPRGGPRPTPVARLLDVTLVGMVCFYAAATLMEAIRFVSMR